jgi:pilus biogenesis lipoprotein CpaD
VRHSLLAAIVTGAVIGLAACASEPDVSGLPERQAPKSIQVVRTDQELIVRIDPATGEPAPADRQHLLDFIAGLSRKQAIHVALSGPQRRERLERLVRILVAGGIEPRHVTVEHASPTPPHAPDRVALDIAQYTLVLPACPDWSRPDALGDENPVFSNLGCATATNFSQMLADPKDLVEGRSAATVPAGPAADAVAAYRADKVKEIPSDKQPPNLISIGGTQ